MICINCENEIANPYVNCPHCGYRYTASDLRICPNKSGASCNITETLCKEGMDYMRCLVKLEADKEIDF